MTAETSTQKRTDLRTVIRKNELKTWWTILSFIGLYMSIGAITDLIIFKGMHINMPIEECIITLITLKQVPYVTVLMAVMAYFILFVTYTMFDRIMLLGTSAHLITPKTTHNEKEILFYTITEEMTVAAGLKYMPRLFVIDAHYMNAFASGYNEKSAMIAITRGLLEKLDHAELQAVIAHELSHIRHHDIKLTLTVAVLSNMMLILVDLMFYKALFKNRQNENRLWLALYVLRYMLSLFTAGLTLFLSRTREFMADAGAIELTQTSTSLAKALVKITDDHQKHWDHYIQEYNKTPHEEVRQSSYIYDPAALSPVTSLSHAFSSHPSLEARLKAIGAKYSK